MRSVCLLLLSTAAAFAQPFGFGVKIGLPMNDFLDVARNQNLSFSTYTNRYIIGPSAELRLPAGFGIELDVLYRHFGYSSFGFSSIASATAEGRTSTSAWEFPLVGKYKFKGIPLLHPYVEAGVSWNKFSGLSQSVTSTIVGITKTSSTSSPPELAHDSTRGFVLGGGLDFKVLVVHIVPEIRYTRWGAKQFFDPNGLLDSNQNQGEFLLGIKF